MREIESDGGKTTFEIEFNLMEESSEQAVSDEPTSAVRGEEG